jgi:hypothetical protein
MTSKQSIVVSINDKKDPLLEYVAEVRHSSIDSKVRQVTWNQPRSLANSPKNAEDF